MFSPTTEKSTVGAAQEDADQEDAAQEDEAEVDEIPDDVCDNTENECPNNDWDALPDEDFPPHSQLLTKEQLQQFDCSVQLPPKTEFQYALYALLNHPSIPLYIFPSVIKLLNSAICSKNRELTLSSPFKTCRSTTLKEMQKNFPVPRAMSVSLETRTKHDGMQSTSLVVFDVKATILQEVQNLDLWKLENLAIKGNRWRKHEPECNQGGMRNLSEAVSGEAYSRAYQKFVTNPEKQLFVPFGCWIDESGVTGNLRHPVQPLLVKCLLLKRPLQRNCILSYIPCATKSSAENKQDTSSKVTRGNNLRNFHSAETIHR